MTELTSLHRKYRPNTLEELLGHEGVVTRLKGIAESGNLPNAIMFLGPPSAGKTTMARALAAAVNGVDDVSKLGSDYLEINCSDKRGIDDVRDIVEKSKYKPRNKKRVIVLDEVQGLISNAQAAAALLKPLEEPSKDTLWILCTMDPGKFSNTNGKAFLTRCTQFVLEAQTKDALTKQALRILKGEKMKYAQKLVPEIVERSNGEMRTLANIIESVQQYYTGLKDKPKQLKEDVLTEVINTTESKDEDLAVEVMASVYAGQFARAQTALLDVSDGVRFINLLLQGNSFLMNVQALNGKKHPKVWWTPSNRKLLELTKPLKLTLGSLAATNVQLVEAKALINNFTVTAEEALSSKLYLLIKDLYSTPTKEKKNGKKSKK